MVPLLKTYSAIHICRPLQISHLLFPLVDPKGSLILGGSLYAILFVPPSGSMDISFNESGWYVINSILASFSSSLLMTFAPYSEWITASLLFNLKPTNPSKQ